MSSEDTSAFIGNAEQRTIVTIGESQKENVTIEQISNDSIDPSLLGKEVSCPSHLNISSAPLLSSKHYEMPNVQEGTLPSMPECDAGCSHSKGQAEDEPLYEIPDASVLDSGGGIQDKTQSNGPTSNAIVSVTEIGNFQKTTILSDKQTPLSLERGVQQERLCDTEKSFENQTALDVHGKYDFQTKAITAKSDRANCAHTTTNQELFSPEIRDSLPKETPQMSNETEQVLMPMSSHKTSTNGDTNDDLSECMPVILNVRGNAVDLDVTEKVDQTNDGENVKRNNKIYTYMTSFPSQPGRLVEKHFDDLITEAGKMSQKNCTTEAVSIIPTDACRRTFHVSSASIDTVPETTLRNSAQQSIKASVSNNSRKIHSLPPSIYVNRVSGSQGPDTNSRILSNSCDQLHADTKDAKCKQSVINVQPKMIYSLLKPTKTLPFCRASQTTSTIPSSSSHRIISSSKVNSGCLSSERLNSDSSKLGNLDLEKNSFKVLNQSTSLPSTILVQTQKAGVTTSAPVESAVQSKQPPSVIIWGDQHGRCLSTEFDQHEPESALSSIDLLPEYRGMNRLEILASGLLKVNKKIRTDLSKQHVCFVCGDEFHTKEFLQFHLKRNVFVLTYFCNVCHKFCTFHNKCTFVLHVLEEAVSREEKLLNIETSFMKLVPYLPPDAQTKSLESLSQSDQSVVPSSLQSTSGFLNNQRLSTTVVPCDQRLITTLVPSDYQSTTSAPFDKIGSTTVVGDPKISIVIPPDQMVSTTVVPFDPKTSRTVLTGDQWISTFVPGDPKISTTTMTGDQMISTTVVPKDPKISTAVFLRDNQSTTVTYNDSRLSTAVVYTDQRLSTTVVPSEQRLSTKVFTSDQRLSVNVPGNRKTTIIVPSNRMIIPSYRQPIPVVSSKCHLSTSVASINQSLSKRVALTDQRLSTTLVPSDLSTIVSKDQRSSTTVFLKDSRPSKLVVLCDPRPSTTVAPSDLGPSTTIMPSDQRPSATVVSSDQGLSATVVPSDQRPLVEVAQREMLQSKYVCPFCKSDFLTFSGLTFHFQRMSNQTYCCCICKMELFNSCSLSAHCGIHSVEERKDIVTCPECGETLQYLHSFRLLFEHLDSCGHFNLWYTIACACGKIFKSFDILKKHFLEEHLLVRYQCKECFIVRPSMYLVYLHYKTKHPHTLCAACIIIQCSLCKKYFGSPHALVDHVNEEILVFKKTQLKKVYQCFTCLGTLTSASDLNAHQERSHVHKPKRCTLCCGLFMSRQNLVTHLVSKSCSKKLSKTLHLCLDTPSKREAPFDNKLFNKLFELKSLDVVPSGLVVSAQQKVILASNVNESQSEANVPLTQNQTEKNTRSYQSEASHDSRPLKMSSPTSKKHAADDRHKHQCHLCKICLVGSHNFKKHMSHHKDIDLQTGRSHCVICKKMVAETSILSHMEEHQNRGVIVCTLCHRRDFPSLNIARDHSKNWCYYKEVKDWGKDFVRAKSNSLSYADSDSMDHSTSNRDFVSIVSESRGFVESNSISDNEPLVFPCLMCGLAFSSKSAKDDHVSRVHDGTKTVFLCIVCKRRGTRKAFNKKQNVSLHISRKHRIADASAISKLILEEEQNISSGQVILSDVSSQESLDEPPPKRLRQEAEGIFLCGKCGFSNGQRDIFEQHIKTHNPEGEPQCPECGLCFTVNAALKKHLFAVHRIKAVEEYMKCRGIEEIVEDLISDDDDDVDVDVDTISTVSVMEECVEHPVKSLKQPNRKSISMNKIDNSWECNVCYKKFTSEVVLKSHMRNHGMAFIRSRRDRNKDHHDISYLEPN